MCRSAFRKVCYYWRREWLYHCAEGFHDSEHYRTLELYFHFSVIWRTPKWKFSSGSAAFLIACFSFLTLILSPRLVMQTSSKTCRHALEPLLNIYTLKFISCNWLGGHASVLAMDWYGKERINQTPLTNMTINGKAVAAIQNIDNFTFARIYEAGHEVASVFSYFSIAHWEDLWLLQ